MKRLLVVTLLLSSCAAEPVPGVQPSPASMAATSTTIVAPLVTTSTAAGETTSTSTSALLTGLAFETVATDLPFPVVLAPAGAGSLLATKDGRVWAFDPREGVGEVVLDIRDRVRDQGEQGLLGMAERDGRIFIHYTATNGDTVVSEFTGAERVMLRLAQPAANHNGGMLQFGPGGFLYLGLGDGGGAGDIYGHGQNTDSLLGGIVRIDVDSDQATLWSYGLRNPWRFWFDAETLYIGDVGQNTYEEIDVVEFAESGFNFGWPITEALHCFSPRSGCETEGLTLPIVEVAHGDAGTCSITGGLVYRGRAIPELGGHYFYSDYCGSWLRSFFWDGSMATDRRDWVPGPAGRVVSFGVDEDGEIYVLTEAAVLRLVPVRAG
ncbi:MAG: PQQ-dependent sugar dehydrogenase [Acidimicrobiia bacterium]|nr:PQQ-dependent sugar dehydrogenase [Acidimicrobiia bacterium]